MTTAAFPDISTDQSEAGSADAPSVTAAPALATAAKPTAGPAANPVTMELVHRTSERDAFPTAWTHIDENRFLVNARWPHDHPFFAPAQDRRHDPLLIVETMRQTTMLITHAGLGVPVGHHFLLSALGFTGHPEHMAAGDAPIDIDVEVTCSDVHHRAGHVARMRSELVLRRAGQVIGSGWGQINCTSPQVYRRLRGSRTDAGSCKPHTPSLPPHQVGRTDTADVLLSPSPQQNVWRLRVDTGHGTLFQRPNDHIPGMLLLEAARQAARALVSPEPFAPLNGDIAFSRYAEFGSPCWIQAHELPGAEPGKRAVQVTGHQDDRLVFRSTITADAPGGRA
ncbi:ScbA/BarX family gamma-butyrolactone biosynthesis protein [Streptomyces sp. E2N166]|uniref:ScbA/BarX family gamma-butyrolactone biosynthesis protein n=1 Tax=Streptomyces sp. E2N166 TaxID=1851909 RepID=UPI001EE91DD0|nr:ScbA/BarX family gamma-butyrolactone biosynthesis protein [Streptomyces sp. E2N166]